MIPVAKEWSRLAKSGIDDADHLADALKYAFNTAAYIQHLELKAYACECKRCDLTQYTSYKRLNCEYCGSSDPDVFECKELK